MNSGVYYIRNVETQGVYIGSTINFNKRKWSHFYRLRNNTHDCRHLQNSFNKYGEDKYIFEIVARCPPEYLQKLEQWFLDNRKEKLYNTLRVAYSSLGFKHSENFKDWLSNRQKNMSDYTRIKIAHSLYGKRHTEETKKKMSESSKGFVVTEEHRLRLSESHRLISSSIITKIFKLYNEGKPPREIAKVMNMTGKKVNSVLDCTKYKEIKKHLGLVKNKNYKYATKNRKEDRLL